MASDDIATLSLTAVSDQIRRRALSPVEVTETMLARIARYDGTLRSFITVMAEPAMAQARKAEAEIMAGFWRGPLHGVPIALKDLCYTTAAPTSAGMALHRGFMAPFNATVVDRLDTAGAVTLGKLSMTEGAFAAHHPAMPKPVNPWHGDYWTGASSSGSGVATAAGLCYGSLGSDTGGSIRLPSNACGLTGLKPTWGRVSRHGIFPLSETLDHIGPMTRTAADAAAMLTVIAGGDAADPTSLGAPVPDYGANLGRPIRGLRIGIAEAYLFDGLAPAVESVIRAAMAAFASLGAVLVPVDFPAVEPLAPDWVTLSALEAAIAHEATYPARKAEYGPELASFLETGLAASSFDVGKAVIERRKFTGRVARVFDTVEALLIPVLPTTVPTVAAWDKAASGDIGNLLRYTAPFDMTGSPTITLPGGADALGVPIGFQLVGAHLSEEMLLRAGHAFQQVTDFHTRHPALA